MSGTNVYGVDYPPSQAYFVFTMLRRLLACLAFVTGLAAIGTPAEARLVMAVSQDLGSTALTREGGQQAPCAQSSSPAKAPPRTFDQCGCRARRTIVIVIPTVQIGCDRARE
jgi:hypothetical protein